MMEEEKGVGAVTVDSNEVDRVKVKRV